MTVNTHKEYQDLYFLSFAKESSKCVGNISIFLSKNISTEQIHFCSEPLLTRKEDDLMFAVLIWNSFTSVLYFRLLMQP